MPHFTPVQNHPVIFFSKIFIYDHSSKIPAFNFYVCSPSINGYWSFVKKTVLFFIFFTNLQLYILYLFLHNHSLKPILYHLTKSYDIWVVGWGATVQNNMPIFSVYTLYSALPDVYRHFLWAPQRKIKVWQSWGLVQVVENALQRMNMKKFYEMCKNRRL